MLNETNNQSQAQPPDQAQQPPQPPQAPLQPPQQPFAQSLFNQLPIPSGPAHQTTPSSSLNILMPSNQPSNIPGLIPLVPLNPQHYQQSQQNGNSLPINLSEEDLRILGTTTREALEQRLRVLTSVDEQISDTIIKLTRVLSVMPVDTPSQEQQQQQQQQQTSQEAAGAVSQDEVVAPDTASENDNQSGEQQQDMSDRRREKMPDYSASSQAEQE